MIITRKAISRRTMLRGVGATLALPLLDGMVPALAAVGKTAGRPVNRFGAVYVPNGMMMPSWTPAAEGAAFEFTPILRSLEPFRDHVLVLSGLNSKTWPGEKNTAHSKASTKFLTDSPPKATSGADLLAGTSMDQMLAREFASQTQLASLELGLESTDSAGSCDVGFSCAYSSTICWRSESTPLPMENNPRTVFERMFGDGGSTDPAARRARMQQERSILDSLLESVDRFQRGLGTGDRAKLSEYLEGVRDVERRIQNAETESVQELPVLDHPAGIPATFEEHAKLMYDLQVLAYQSDMTRVVTFMIGREFSGRQYPEIGVPDAHHPISHHAGDPAKIAGLAKIEAYHVRLFAYYLEKLRATPDGDGSLLDHMTIIYGAGMADSNAHTTLNLPMLLVGGGAGQFKGGRHLRYPAGTPLSNLHLTVMNSLGLHVDRMSDSTGMLDSIL
jgi:uncharacterized protein DUF1552